MLLKITNEDGSINLEFSGTYEPLDEDHKRAGYIKNNDSVRGNDIVYNSSSGPSNDVWDNIIIQLTGETIPTNEYFTIFALENEFGFKVYLEQVRLIDTAYDNEFENILSNGVTRYEVVDHVHNTVSYENIKGSASATLSHVYGLLAPFIVYDPTPNQSDQRGTIVGTEPKQTVKRIHYEDQNGSGTMSERTINGQSIYAGNTINSDVNDPDEDAPIFSQSFNRESVMPVKCVQNCDTLGRAVGTADGDIDFTDRTKKYWVIKEEMAIDVDLFTSQEEESEKTQISGRNSDQDELTKDQIKNALDLPSYHEWDYWMQARFPFHDTGLFIEEDAVKPVSYGDIVGNKDYFKPVTRYYRTGQITQQEWLQTSYSESHFERLEVPDPQTGMPVVDIVKTDTFSGSSEEDFLDSNGNPWPDTGVGSNNRYGYKNVSSWASGGRLDDHAMFVYFMVGCEEFRTNINAPFHVIRLPNQFLYGNLEGGNGNADKIRFLISASNTKNNQVVGPEAWDNSNIGHNNTIEFGTGWYLGEDYGSIQLFNAASIDGPFIDDFNLTFRKNTSVDQQTLSSGQTAEVVNEWREYSVRCPVPTNRVVVTAVPAFHRYPLVLNGDYAILDGTNSGEAYTRGTISGNNQLRLYTGSGEIAHEWAKAELWRSLERINNLKNTSVQAGYGGEFASKFSIDPANLQDVEPNNTFQNYESRDNYDWGFNHAQKSDQIELMRVALAVSSTVVAVKRRTLAIEATTDAFEDETLPARAEIIYPPDAIDDLGYDSIISDPPGAIDDLGYDSIISDVPSQIIDLEYESIISDPPNQIDDLETALEVSDPPGLIYLNDPEVVDPRSIGCAVYTVTVVDERKEWCGITQPSKYKGFVFDERADALSGPFADSYITAITTKDNTAEMIAVDQDKGLLKTDLRDFNEQKFPLTPDLDQVYPELNTRMDQTGLEKGVVCSRIGEGFSYRGIFQQLPFSETSFGYGCVQDPLFFRDSTLAVVESNWIHLGDEHNEKQVHRIDLSFHKNSFGALWGYVCNEEGEYKGQYKGEVQEHMKVFTNLRGRRFKTKLFIVTHPKYPWALREMSLGHLYGKSF